MRSQRKRFSNIYSSLRHWNHRRRRRAHHFLLWYNASANLTSVCIQLTTPVFYGKYADASENVVCCVHKRENQMPVRKKSQQWITSSTTSSVFVFRNVVGCRWFCRRKFYTSCSHSFDATERKKNKPFPAINKIFIGLKVIFFGCHAFFGFHSNKDINWNKLNEMHVAKVGKFMEIVFCDHGIINFQR